MNPYTINPPESDVVFEKLCLALLKLHWARPGLERFAKKGDEQFGVDLLDTRAESPMYAAQCKLKEQSKSLSPGEIREEVRKAETFPSKLDHYAILTTGKISGAAQLAIQTINQEHRRADLFTVELFTWEKITELIRQYPEIEQQFYGGLRPEEALAVKVGLDHIAKLAESMASSSATSEIDALIDEARTHITPRDAQIAVLLLNRINRTRGGELSNWHRFRVNTNLGAANLVLGKCQEAARYFLDARVIQPDDELAITNEVLAYHLLLQRTETFRRAAAAIERFPNSSRLRSLWIQAETPDASYEKLLEATPDHLRKDAEVASALSRRAMAKGLVNCAIEHAKDAIIDKPDWSQAHLLLAQAYFSTVAMVSGVPPLNVEHRERNLAESITAAEKAISIATIEGDAHTRAQALALKSDIALTQGRREEGARFARESFSADPTDLNGQLAMGQASVMSGDLDEGIRILEEAYARADNAIHVSFMLGQALMARGLESDLSRAIEVLTSARLETLDRELIDPIIVSAVRAMMRLGRFVQVASYITSPEVVASPVLMATISAQASLTQSDDAEAGKWLDEALASRKTTDSRATTDFLARALVNAGRLSDALPLLQELFSGQTPSFDVGLLLNCAARLKRDDVIMNTCEELHKRGIQDWQLVEFESKYLEEYDFPKAIHRLQEFIATNPTHCLAKIRLAITGIRNNQENLVQVSEAILPDPEDLPMEYALPVIHLLQWHHQGKLAVDFAYRLLRVHYSELEAHEAYLASLIAAGAPEDIPATIEAVETGSAVQFIEGDCPPAWFVIEDTDKPSSEFEEVAANSEIAQELLGKRIGDSFVLAKSPLRDRVAKIVQILSKYTRRFQAIGEQMQIKFGPQSPIQRLPMPSPEKLTVEDVQPILDSVKAHSEAVSRMAESYKMTPVTLHMYGAQLGHSAYEALITLAVSDDDFVRCAAPKIEAITNVLVTLGTKNSVVIDLTALATLHLLGIARQMLASAAFQFVMTPATLTELQELRAQRRFSAHHGTMHYRKGQHYYTETTEEQFEKQKVLFEEYMRCIESNVKVVPVPQRAGLKPDRRDLLEGVLGRYGVESALLSQTPGYIWWTDDYVAGEVAKSELGVERTWTQAIVEHIAHRGLIDRKLADETFAKLVGFNYQSTHFTGAVMVAALRAANGVVNGFPMVQVIQAFEPLPTSNLSVAFRMLAEFILRIMSEPLLPETKCLAIKALLNTFPRSEKIDALLVAFRFQCANLMNLNPVARIDFIKCFDRWNNERASQRYIVGP